MRSVLLLRIGEADQQVIETLAADLSETLSSSVEVVTDRLPEPSFAFLPERRQYNSSEILLALTPPSHIECLYVGITDLDLCIPILTFVFGEAESGGRRALVSYHRLRQDYYGLPPDPSLMSRRLAKETLHEIGHLYSLHHCQDFECLMASSHSVEWIDLKEGFCPSCVTNLTQGLVNPNRNGVERVL